MAQKLIAPISFSTLKILATVKHNTMCHIHKLSFSTLKILATVKLTNFSETSVTVLVPLRF